MIDTNKLTLIGKIISIPTLNQKKHRYEFTISVPRKSNRQDILPCYIPERLYDMIKEDLDFSTLSKFSGRLCTENTFDEQNRSHLHLYAFILNVMLPEEHEEYCNTVELTAHVCRKPTSRVTPKGKNITETLLACNSTNKRSEYLPTIFWNKISTQANKLNVQDTIKLIGRFQSRDYVKAETDNQLGVIAYISKTAYELSCVYFEKI